MLSAGDLKTRGTLQQRAVVPDDQGGNPSQWTDVACLWSEVVFQQGAERFASDALNPLNQYTITIRYRAGVTGSAYGADASMRFVVGARIFDIRSVTDLDEAHEALVLGCELYTP